MARRLLLGAYKYVGIQGVSWHCWALFLVLDCLASQHRRFILRSQGGLYNYAVVCEALG